MGSEVSQRQRRAQARDQLLERAVLRFVESAVVAAFELDADGEVVAGAAAAVDASLIPSFVDSPGSSAGNPTKERFALCS